MNPRIAAGLIMMALWIGVTILVCVRYPDYREPFSGRANVSLFWFLMVLMLVWNALRVLKHWERGLDRPKPPVRREIEDDPQNPFA